VLEELCRTAVADLRLLGAAVSLYSSSGAEAIAAVSDEAIRGVEQLQLDHGEGPGRAAFTAGRPDLTSDLAEIDGRWPGYAPAAREAGVGAVYAFPLQLGASRFGVLTFYSDRARQLDSAELAACLFVVDQVTETLLYGETTSDEWRPEVPRSLRFRTEVYQAQGMVMVLLGVSLVDALARMRAHAYVTGVDLDEVALDIIAGKTQLERGNDP